MKVIKKVGNLLIFLEFFEEYKHPDVISPSGYPLEFDYFYPKLNIAIEYQVKKYFLVFFSFFKGQQHYNNSRRFHGKDNLEDFKTLDYTKSKLCKEKGNF
jgi:hypothetical protein